MPKIAMHRGSTSTMTTTAKKNIVLEDGELFVEVPDSITDSNQYKFKVGDGVTTYENLPYALDPTNMAANDDDATYVENTNVTLSSSEPTSVTVTDSAITTNSNIEVYCNSDVAYSSLSKSNGSCVIVFPKQSSSITINILLRISDEYYKSIDLSGLGDATAAQVYEGYTFSSANGVLLTGTASAGSSVKIGDAKTCSLSGSHTVSSYSVKVCYVSDTEICLIGQTNLGNTAHSTARGYTWTATFAAGVIDSSAKTISGVKIPTITQIREKCCGWYLDAQAGNFNYWTYSYYNGDVSNKYMSDTISNSYAWIVYDHGYVTTGSVSTSCGVVPYIIIPL